MIRRLGDGEDGTSVLELGVAMLVTSLMAAASVAWLGTAGLVDALHEADDIAVQDLRVAKELMSRDLRNAADVVTAGPGSVTVWIDGDDDRLVGPGESVSWAITSDGDLVRSTDTGESGIYAGLLDTSASGFSYDAAAPSDVTRIGVTLIAAVVTVDGDQGSRSLGFEIRLRNT